MTAREREAADEPFECPECGIRSRLAVDEGTHKGAIDSCLEILDDGE